jgi:hypothetical protein
VLSPNGPFIKPYYRPVRAFENDPSEAMIVQLGLKANNTDFYIGEFDSPQAPEIRKSST